MIRLFVTGTDTGVGKTTVSVALARRLVGRGRRVLAFKPVETGCEPGELGADQQLLVAAAGGWQRGDAAGLYQFRQAAAPAVAARAEGQRIDIARIAETMMQHGTDAVIVEGAGGWRVPVTDQVDMSGLAQKLGLPVLVVARAGLGTINHSLLTVEAVRRDGCEVAGLVLSERPEDDKAFTASNAKEIGARWPGRIAIYRGGPADLDCFT